MLRFLIGLALMPLALAFLIFIWACNGIAFVIDECSDIGDRALKRIRRE